MRQPDLSLRQRFHRFCFVLADAQNERTIAVDGNDVRVAARRAVLAHQTTVEDSIRNRFKVQLFRQVVTAKPARFNRFSPACSARQRFVIVAGSIAHFLLQRIVGIQRFFLLHFRRDIVTNVSQRLGFRR
jgi:ApbE superfamily uncharacterized protein (UPF0280 family)